MFQGLDVSHGTGQRLPRFACSCGGSPAEPIPRPTKTVKQKRKLCSGKRRAWPSSDALPPRHGNKRSNIKLLPFRGTAINSRWYHLRPRLGLANPRRTELHAEPFPTSVFHESQWNICYYHQDLHYRSVHRSSQNRLLSNRHVLLLNAV